MEQTIQTAEPLRTGRTSFGPETVSAILFFGALAAWMFFFSIQKSFYAALIPGDIFFDIRVACVVALVLSEVIWHHWTPSDALWLAIVAVVSYSCLRYAFGNVAVTPFFIFCARNRNLRHCAYVAFFTLSFTLIFVVVSAKLGIIPDLVGASKRGRHFLGFRWPLIPQLILFCITTLVVYLRGEKLSLPIVILLLAASWLLHLLTDSRLSFGIGAALIVACYLARAVKWKPGRASSAILASSFIVAAVVSYAFTMAYDPEVAWMASLNNALGNRLFLGKSGIEEFGINLLGKPVKLVAMMLTASGKQPKGTYNFIDCLYIQAAVLYGVVTFVAYMAGMTAATWRAFRSGDVFLGLALVALALHGMIDNETIFLNYNALLLAMAQFMAAKKVSDPSEDPPVAICETQSLS